MPEMFYIDEKRSLPIAQQYEWLRAQGMRHIEELGHALWTDYNTHDPGVTMLEAIVFALTELSYRNHFSIEDLLSAADGQIHNQTFFTAKKILTTAPLTINDYRRLLIDQPGVANAWFIPTQKSKDAGGYFQPHNAEQSVFLNQREDKLSLTDTNIFGEKLNDQLKVRGLNKVMIELEEDVLLGDMNSTALEYAVYVDEHWIEMVVVPNFEQWNEEQAALTGSNMLSYTVLKEAQSLRLNIIVDDQQPGVELVLSLQPKDITELDLLLQQLLLPASSVVNELLGRLQQKKIRVGDIRNQVLQTLQANRNLGEDFLCIETVGRVNIAVCANITLGGQVNPIDVLQKIYALIDEMFDPAIQFNSLSELLAQGMSGDEIFSGPVLQHGFITDKALARTGLPECLHTSDIIAAIMALDGVVAVDDVLLSAVDAEGKPFNDQINQPWSLKLDGQHKPRFSTAFSKIKLYRENLPVFINEQQQKALSEFMQMLHLQKQQQKSLYTYEDLTVPEGKWYPLNSYTSIQRELPAVYAVGGNELMPDATAEQHAQRKQLKAYLHFFDQLLADLFQQLYQAKDLLDTAPINDTYFPQFLQFNPDSEEVFDGAEIYGSNLQQSLQTPFFATNEKVFLDRRHRSLDHLLARFCESFSDYAFMMFQSDSVSGTPGDERVTQYELIEDKTDFLNQYDQISYSRGLAMDYHHATWQQNSQNWQFDSFWNTEHRSGYERRVARLLGIDVTALTNIFPTNSTQTEMSFLTSSGQVVIKMLQPQTNPDEKWEWMQLHVADPAVYQVQKIIKNYRIFLMDQGNKIAQIDLLFTSLADAERMKSELMQAISDAFENFYLLEHILLRPFPVMNNDALDLMPVCLQDECKDDTGADPWSFRATLVLPGYVSRFRNIAFRKYAEKIFRQEAPAHVLLKICWVGKNDLLLFQEAYHNWLDIYRLFRLAYCENTLVQQPSLVSDFVTRHRALINALNQLNTIYPEGNLYDCHRSETSTPMILGSSSLGTLK